MVEISSINLTQPESPRFFARIQPIMKNMKQHVYEQMKKQDLFHEFVQIDEIVQGLCQPMSITTLDYSKYCVVLSMRLRQG